jgi:DNA-binding response OmpR family regulator
MKPLLLVAEGDGELCQVYQSFLAGHNYDVSVAADGLECLDQLRRVTPAVLILDRELRWGGSAGVLAWLREQGGNAGVSVVMTTAAACAEDFEFPVVSCLSKPFALSALLESVRCAVGRTGREEFSASKWGTPLPELFIG